MLSVLWNFFFIHALDKYLPNPHCVPAVGRGAAVGREEHSNEGSVASQLLKSGLCPRGKGILSRGWGGKEREAKWLALSRGWERPGGQSGQ